jgi:thiol:disulfide interchange protein
MLKRLVVIAALFLALVPAWSGDARLPERFEPQRDAAADLELALSIAQQQGKRVLVDVGGEWCSWCHILDRFIAANDDVRAVVQTRYVWLKVNFSPQNKNELLLSRWPKVTGYPHLFVLNANGQVIRSQATSELEAGQGYNRAKVLGFLEKNAG